MCLVRALPSAITLEFCVYIVPHKVRVTLELDVSW